MSEVRLIDANALLDATEHLAQVCFGQGQCYCERTKFQQLIKKQPTIDAVPVVHAHWIHTHTSSSYWTECYKCSACGYEDETFMGTESDYCSACGAKMDEKENGNAAD